MPKSTLSNVLMNPATSMQPGYCVDSDAPGVRKIAARLTARCHDAREQARRLFDFVRDEIRYNFAPDVRERLVFISYESLVVL